MRCILSRLPDVNRKLTVDGILTIPSRLFLDFLQRIIDLDIEISYRIPRYDSLLLLDAAFPIPNPNMMVVVTGQGQAIFKVGIGWVKAADDTTLIT